MIIKKLTSMKCDRLMINLALEKITEFFSLILNKREHHFTLKNKNI